MKPHSKTFVARIHDLDDLFEDWIQSQRLQVEILSSNVVPIEEDRDRYDDRPLNAFALIVIYKFINRSPRIKKPNLYE